MIRTVLRVAFATGTGLLASLTCAQSFPARTVSLIVSSPPGGTTDFTARMLAQRFSEMWGQQVVVDNRAGASGVIAHEIAARAVPDGYTILLSTSAGIVITPLLGLTLQWYRQTPNMVGMGMAPRTRHCDVNPAMRRSPMFTTATTWRPMRRSGV